MEALYLGPEQVTDPFVQPLAVPLIYGGDIGRGTHDPLQRSGQTRLHLPGHETAYTAP